MKTRIKIDSSILSFIIILTGFLYLFPYLYSPQTPWLEVILDFFGVIVLLSGTYLRMVARGHKKANSGQGHALVKDGVYGFVRNPMYLGSYLMGVGFILLVWPWWTLPLFTILFYNRFMIQVKGEEAHLLKMFGQGYEDYCLKVPRIFPTVSVLHQVNFVKTFPVQEALNTKDRRGIWVWPLVALVLETFQQKMVFGIFDLTNNIPTFMFAIFVFTMGLWVLYLTAPEAENYVQDSK